MTAILIIMALLCVVGVKYYTALGKRNLERRLGNTRRDLDAAKDALRQARDRSDAIEEDEQLAMQRLQYMKELIEDLKIRLTTSDEADGISLKEETAPPPAMYARF